MKLFLDTADISQIKFWADKGVIEGVTTNPTHLAKEAGDPVQKIKEICALVNGPVSVEVTEFEPADVLAQAVKIASIADNVVVKIPCHLRYYPVIKNLVSQGIKLNITLVFTLTQGLAMCKLGVHYISPFIGRLDDIDSSGLALVDDLVRMVANYGFDTQVLAASIRSVDDLHEVIMLGASCATVPADVLEKSLEHPLINQGIEKFLSDWKKLGIIKFP